MLIEIHMIQNHSPANLNRDDLGAPKSCVFGGVSRARISSQAIKRSIRKPANPDDIHNRKPGMLAEAMSGFMGVRTKLFPWLVAEELKRSPIPDIEWPGVVRAAQIIASSKEKAAIQDRSSSDADPRPKTAQLIHLGPSHARDFVAKLSELRGSMDAEYRYYLKPDVLFQETLKEVVAETQLAEDNQKQVVGCAWLLATQRKSELFSGSDGGDEIRELDWSNSAIGRHHAEAIVSRLVELETSDPDQYKRILRRPSPEEKRLLGLDVQKPARLKQFTDALRGLDRHDAVDIALFGRMTTSDAFEDVEAAVQVAHAISTHQVVNEVDYFTAVDDFGKTGGGAGHVDEAMFNSACFYKYFSIDWDQLVLNLCPADRGTTGEQGATPEVGPNVLALAAAAVGHFLRAAALSTPSGKQNSFAAHNPPEAILVEVKREKIPFSYANAFADPVRPTAEGPLVRQSVSRLAAFAREMAGGYGIESTRFWFSPGGRFAWSEIGGEDSGAPQSTTGAESVSQFEEFVGRVVKTATGLDWQEVRDIGRSGAQGA